MRAALRSASHHRGTLRPLGRALSSNMSSSTNAEAGPSRATSAAGPSLRNIKPPSLKGMQTLDRSQFTVRIPVISAKIPAARVGDIRNRPEIKRQVLDIPRVRSVETVAEDETVRLLRMRVASTEELPDETRKVLAAEGAEMVPDTVTIGYDHWTPSEVLHSILPTDQSEDIPTAVTMTGHIGHVNLLEEWLPYKHLIGQVLLDKTKNLRTIVNKLGTIHEQYRYFDMEVLAGDADYITTVNESGCLFTFDFSKVYWNSRLGTEHARLIGSWKAGEVVADVMAGVGPFAVPAAKKGVYVLGNDLNPESVKWMRHNRVQNKVEQTLRVTETDGREFIKRVAPSVWEDPFNEWVSVAGKRKAGRDARRGREAANLGNQGSAPVPAVATGDVTSSLAKLAINGEKRGPPAPKQLPPQLVDHFVMNLPDSALEFLDAFQGCYASLLSFDTWKAKYTKDDCPMPMVHVYCFTREMERPGAEADICKRASEHLGYPIRPETAGYHLHLVRSVAPLKEMYCLSFRLPREVAFASPGPQ